MCAVRGQKHPGQQSMVLLSLFVNHHRTDLDGSARQRYDQRVQAPGTQSCFPMMCYVHAAGWTPKRATVGLSARISTRRLPHVVQKSSD
jgi:hypothetical protein